MKRKITSAEYWDLTDDARKKYRRVSLVYNGRDWVERTYYGSENVRVEVMYVLI